MNEALSRLMLLITTSAGFAIIGMGAAILGPALPVFSREFGLSTTMASVILTTQWTGCVLGVVAMYFLSDRLTARPGLALLAIGSALMAWSPAVPAILAGGFIFGLGNGAIGVQFNPRVLIAYGPRGPQMLSLINAAFSAGTILAPLGFLLVGGSPRPVFAVMAVASTLCLIPGTLAGMTGVTHAARGQGFRLSLPILAIAFLASGIETSLGGLGPTALIRTGVDEVTAAKLLSLLFTVSFITRLALALVAHRIDAFAVMTFAVIWALAMTLGVIFWGPWPFFPLFGIATALFFQGGYVTALRKMGADPRVPSIILGNGLLGAAVAPSYYARAMEVAGTHGYFWTVALVAGLLSLASLLLYRSMTAPSDPAPRA